MNLQMEHDKLLARDTDGRIIGRLLFLDLAPNVVNILSVHVAEEHRGQGIARQMMDRFLEYAREHDKEVIPSCSYAKAYFEQHPELSPLIYQS